MYSKCNVKLRWFETRQQNLVVCEPKLRNFCVRRGIDCSCKRHYPFINVSIRSRDMRNQSLKLSENVQSVDVG